MTKTQSVEPNIADLANGWLKSYKLDYGVYHCFEPDIHNSAHNFVCAGAQKR